MQQSHKQASIAHDASDAVILLWLSQLKDSIWHARRQARLYANRLFLSITNRCKKQINSLSCTVHNTGFVCSQWSVIRQVLQAQQELWDQSQLVIALVQDMSWHDHVIIALTIKLCAAGVSYRLWTASLLGALCLFIQEHLFQLTTLMHAHKDVTATNKFSIDVYLWNCWPFWKLLDTFSDVRICQHIPTAVFNTWAKAEGSCQECAKKWIAAVLTKQQCIDITTMHTVTAYPWQFVWVRCTADHKQKQ